MSRFEALMLDAFGTLIEGAEEAFLRTSEAIVRELLPDVAPWEFSDRWWELVYDLDDEGFLSIAQSHAVSLRRLLGEYGVGAPVEPYLEMVNHRWAEARLYPDVQDFLRRVDGMPVCVVSNADEEFLASLFDHHGLKFDRIITSEYCKCYKPSPRIFRVALRTLGVARDRVLFVGDTPQADILGARRVGIPSAWVNRVGLPYPPGLPTPDLEVRDLLQLLPAVRAASPPMTGPGAALPVGVTGVGQ
jgi:putative hydrolase of the HAD superfamily